MNSFIKFLVSVFSSIVDVLLKATGDAPIMKKKKWAVEGDKRVGWVAEFIRKYLKLDPADNLVSLSCVVCSLSVKRKWKN